MLYKDQPGFIKFALGENKQANWGITKPNLVFHRSGTKTDKDTDNFLVTATIKHQI
jgi:hypothetical protein